MHLDLFFAFMEPKMFLLVATLLFIVALVMFTLWTERSQKDVIHEYFPNYDPVSLDEKGKFLVYVAENRDKPFSMSKPRQFKKAVSLVRRCGGRLAKPDEMETVIRDKKLDFSTIIGEGRNGGYELYQSAVPKAKEKIGIAVVKRI